MMQTELGVLVSQVRKLCCHQKHLFSEFLAIWGVCKAEESWGGGVPRVWSLTGHWVSPEQEVGWHQAGCPGTAVHC